jgi:hypothetical protein
LTVSVATTAMLPLTTNCTWLSPAARGISTNSLPPGFGKSLSSAKTHCSVAGRTGSATHW